MKQALSSAGWQLIIADHRFPNGRRGEIWLEMHESDGHFDLFYRDNGVGLPPGLEPATAKSLGMRIMSDLAEQLGGVLECESARGATFRLRFPSQAGKAEKR